jgi:hypothetical protein
LSMFFEVLESDGVRHAMELFEPTVPKKKKGKKQRKRQSDLFAMATCRSLPTTWHHHTGELRQFVPLSFPDIVLLSCWDIGFE